MRIATRLIAPAVVSLALLAGAPAGALPARSSAVPPATQQPAAVQPAAVQSAVVQSAAVQSATALAPTSVTASAVNRGPSRILLTPGHSTASTQLVTWTMGQTTPGMRVQYRVAGTWFIRTEYAKKRAAIKKKYAGTKAPRYQASLTELKAGTAYSYRIVTRYGITAWYTFRTESPKAKAVTFIGLGDTQIANRTVPKSTVNAAIKAVPKAAAILQAGDTVNNPTKDSQWAGLFSAIGTSGRTRDWLVSIGNHERCVLTACKSGNAQAFRNYFSYAGNGYPKQEPTWYFVDYPNVRVVVLDSFSATAGTTQVTFLDSALTTNKKPFSIVLMHAPVFSSVAGRAALPQAKAVQRVIEKHNVDLVLSGHDHSYARGYRNPNATVYVTSVSGPKYYRVSGSGWKAGGATRVVWAQGTSTYQVITVSDKKLTYKAVVSNRGKTSTSPFGKGGVLDKFVIDKTRPADKIVR